MFTTASRLQPIAILKPFCNSSLCAFVLHLQASPWQSLDAASLTAVAAATANAAMDARESYSDSIGMLYFFVFLFPIGFLFAGELESARNYCESLTENRSFAGRNISFCESSLVVCVLDVKGFAII